MILAGKVHDFYLRLGGNTSSSREPLCLAPRHCNYVTVCFTHGISTFCEYALNFSHWSQVELENIQQYHFQVISNSVSMIRLLRCYEFFIQVNNVPKNSKHKSSTISMLQITIRDQHRDATIKLCKLPAHNNRYLH